MERTKQVQLAAAAVVIALLGLTAAWLFRTPDTRAVTLTPATAHR